MLIAREVQHRAGNHRVHAAILVGKAIDGGLNEVLRRQLRREPGRRLPDHLNGAGVLVYAVAGEAVPKQIDQIPAVAAPGIEHAATRIEAAAHDLIEEVDVDVAELRAQLATDRPRRRHTAAAAGDQSGSGRPNQIHAM